MELIELLEVETSLLLLKQYVGDPTNRLFFSVDVVIILFPVIDRFSEKAVATQGC